MYAFVSYLKSFWWVLNKFQCRSGKIESLILLSLFLEFDHPMLKEDSVTLSSDQCGNLILSAVDILKVHKIRDKILLTVNMGKKSFMIQFLELPQWLGERLMLCEVFT